MPGKPITRAAVARLETYTLEAVLERVMEGESLRKIATDSEIAVSRPMLSWWLLGRVGAPEESDETKRTRRNLYEQARRLSAIALADKVLSQVDGETDARATQLARGRAEFRRRVTEIYNPARFGQKALPAVTTNVGAVHLEALRRSAQRNEASRARGIRSTGQSGRLGVAH